MGVAKGKTRPHFSLSTVQRYDIKNWPRPFLSVFVQDFEKKIFFLILMLSGTRKYGKSLQNC